MQLLDQFEQKVRSKRQKAIKKKGQMSPSSLIPLALTIVLLVVVVGVGALVLNEMNNTVTDGNTTDILDAGTSAMSDFSDWFSIIVVIGVSAVVIGLLGFFRGKGKSVTA